MQFVKSQDMVRLLHQAHAIVYCSSKVDICRFSLEM